MGKHQTMKAPSLWRQEPDEPTLLMIGKLAEEAGELAARAARCIIQGLDAKDPDTGRTNREELEREIADVRGLGDLAIDRLGLDLPFIAERAITKRRHKDEWLRMVEAAASDQEDRP